MTDLEQPREFQTAARFFGATLLTGVVSPVIFAVPITIIFWFSDTSGQPSAAHAGGFGALIAVFGVIFALPLSLLGGGLIELPKAVWLSKRTGGAIIHWLLSVVGGSVMIGLTLFLFFILSGDFDNPGNYPQDTDNWEAIALIASVGLIAGSASAIAWWKIVIEPWRVHRAAHAA